MEHIKLQLGCVAVLLFISIIYIFRLIHYKRKVKFNHFLIFILVSLIALVFDGITAYSVNNLETFPYITNLICHAIFLASLDSIIFLLFLQILMMSNSFPKKLITKILIFTPFIINLIILFAFIPELGFIENKISNYSTGVSAYTCFIMVFIYALASIVVLIVKWKKIELRKKTTTLIVLSLMILTSTIQAIYPYILITSITIIVFILGIYFNLEDPLIVELYSMQKEMIMGFAMLIESRDESTGEHVLRTTNYVQIILDELKKDKKYKKIITKEFYDYVSLAAPLHDIGKISVPDYILQKPGKLTNEEFEIIKSHTTNGAKIIKETFGKTSNEKYYDISYNVALYHHEKFNGNGYPNKISGENIPLEARIMSVADVFDAVSAKRCYRDALPLDTCFEIIEKGKGTDFDPEIVDAFLKNKDKIRKVIKSN